MPRQPTKGRIRRSDATDSRESTSPRVADGATERELLQLLQKISQQLDNMRRFETKGQIQGQNIQPPGTDSSVASLNKYPAPQTQGQMSQETPAFFGQRPMNNQEQPMESPVAQSNGTVPTQQRTTLMQDSMGQVAQAQFELSQELEASLQKLQQVITESEKLATKVSNIIMQENNSQ